MSSPASRTELKEYCLRQLGKPVIKINVDDSQVEDAVDAALQYFHDFHFDGVERTYTKHQLTIDDITNNYLTVSDNIIGITRVFPLTSSNASVNMFDLRYQLRLHDLYDFTSVSYVGYTLTMQHIRTLDLLFSGEQPIRFNRHTNKLYIDWDWTMPQVGEWLIIEGYVITDPNTYTKVYNDRMLKELTTSHIKKVWGNNLKKYGGMALPGGIIINGDKIYGEAVEEIEKLEQSIRRTYEKPIEPLIG